MATSENGTAGRDATAAVRQAFRDLAVGSDEDILHRVGEDLRILRARLSRLHASCPEFASVDLSPYVKAALHRLSMGAPAKADLAQEAAAG